MADARLHIKLSAPEHVSIELEALEAVIPGAAGVFTVLPGHTPLLTTLGWGSVVISKPDGEMEFIAVHRGFAEIMADRIVILADRMEQGDAIDSHRAQESEERARARMERPAEDVDIRRAEAALARAAARLQTHRREEY